MVVDDHTLLRETLAAVLDDEPDLTVVAQAGDGDEAIATAERVRPDVVLLDVQMPGTPATEVVERLAARVPDAKIIVLTMHESAPVLQEFLRLGVAGYLHKAVSRPHLTSVIRSTSSGDSRVAISVSLRGPAPGLADRPALSEREIEVITLVARAMSNRQVAHQLEIGEATVKRHLQNIFRKLDAVSRVDAVNRAVAAELIPQRAGQELWEPPDPRR
jgi:DNA-binding NarL/FixJ family response regulator